MFPTLTAGDRTRSAHQKEPVVGSVKLSRSQEAGQGAATIRGGVSPQIR